MPLLKRATRHIQARGCDLQVIRGCYGPYLYDPKYRKQTGKVYATIERAIEAALAGERPVGIEPARVACPFCDGPAHAKQCQPQRLAFLLSAHAAAWWRNLRADDFVEQVNATYDAYLAGGGNDEHYDAHWRAMSDAAKEAR